MAMNNTSNLFLRKITARMEQDWGVAIPEVEQVALKVVEDAENGSIEAQKLIYDFLYPNNVQEEEINRTKKAKYKEIEDRLNMLHPEDREAMARSIIDRAIKSHKAEDVELFLELAHIDKYYPVFVQDKKTGKLALTWGYTIRKEEEKE